MSRILRAGTKIPVQPTLSGRVLTLEADVPVADGWASDDAFAGWLHNLDEHLGAPAAGAQPNMALYADDLKNYEVDELTDGVMCHNVYERVYGNQAIKELTLVSSTPIVEESEEVVAEEAVADEEQSAAPAKKGKKADVLDKTSGEAS